MEFLGEVETITNDGRIVVRAVAAPDVNCPVFDGRERRVGTVKRIFGPVDSPYVTVIPMAKGDLNHLLSKKVFYSEGSGNAGDRRRGRRH